MPARGHNSLTDKARKRAKRIHKLARLLDAQFKVPYTNLRFGLDSLLGLIPGAGDTVTAVFAGYIILEAYRLGVSRGTIIKMVGNVVIDWIIGSVPILGDIFDVGFKANLRNIALIEKDLGLILADL